MGSARVWCPSDCAASTTTYYTARGYLFGQQQHHHHVKVEKVMGGYVGLNT